MGGVILEDVFTRAVLWAAKKALGYAFDSDTTLCSPHSLDCSGTEISETAHLNTGDTVFLWLSHSWVPWIVLE